MENKKAKRGNSLPLKISASATVDQNLKAAILKHCTFNECFNSKVEYMLVFKDGSKVETIPGTDPPEPFTLCRYKEVSGFGYSQIKLFLVPVFQKELDDLGSLLVEEDSEFYSSDDDLPDDLPAILPEIPKQH